MIEKFCRVFKQPQGWPESKLHWDGGFWCEAGLPHIGDFGTQKEAEAWLAENPEAVMPTDRIEYRILPVEGYYPNYTTMPLLYYINRKNREEQKENKE
jgi:hypothetical protein